MLGPDYAAQRFVATWEVTVHRTTLGQVGGGEPPGVAPVDTSGTRAYVQLHNQLMAPRGALRVRVGGVDVVNIPANGDVELGPKPLKFVILGFNGEQSLVGEYTVQYTLPNPCPGRNGVMAFLGHVWKAEDDVDREFFLTRTYTGILHLDPRVVGAGSGANGTHPDAIRHLYLPPRTPGTHRVGVRVRTLEDGYTLVYQAVDRQPTAIVNSRAVVRMEAEHRVEHSKPGHFGGSMQREIGFHEQIAAGISAWQPPTFTSPSLTAIATARMLAVLNRVGHLPTVTHDVTATAYGHPASRYGDLSRAARIVVLYRLMNAGMILDVNQRLLEYDGAFIEHNKSDPKAVQCSIHFVTRARALYAAPAPATLNAPQPEQPARIGAPGVNPDQVWADGRSHIPVFAGDFLVPEVITGPGDAQIPASIRNLIYGGSIHNFVQGDGWGWLSTAFAPELMSARDGTAGINQNAEYRRIDAEIPGGIDHNGNRLDVALLAAIQNLCSYKQPVTFNSTGNRGMLP